MLKRRSILVSLVLVFVGQIGYSYEVKIENKTKAELRCRLDNNNWGFCREHYEPTERDLLHGCEGYPGYDSVHYSHRQSGVEACSHAWANFVSCYNCSRQTNNVFAVAAGQMESFEINCFGVTDSSFIEINCSTEEGEHEYKVGSGNTKVPSKSIITISADEHHKQLIMRMGSVTIGKSKK